jgi:hypothetical protein
MMKSQMLGGGAIACSTLLLYGWTQTGASEAGMPEIVPGQPWRATAESGRHNDLQAMAILGVTPTQLLEQLPELIPRLPWSPNSAQSHPLPQEIEVLYSQVLEKAQAMASQAQFSSAIAQVAGIPKNSQSYELAHSLQADWSQELLQQANQHYENAELETAQSLLAAIPATSSLKAQALALKAQWGQQQQIMARAIAAKERGDWQAVIDALQSLDETPLHHSLPVQDLLQQAITQLYEPDQNLTYIAMADTPTVSAAINPAIAPPETLPSFGTWQ